MTKTLVALVVVLLASCAAAANIQRVDTIITTGPCYRPADLQDRLDRDGFDVRVTGQSENSTGKKASVLFYSKDRDFVIVLRSGNLACVLAAGKKLEGV